MTMSVLYRGFLYMQVCVPKETTDEKVVEFANTENPCGTANGWQIVRQGSKFLGGDSERVQCAKCSDNVHIMLEA